jgi:AcrR family transcriptional regulator
MSAADLPDRVSPRSGERRQALVLAAYAQIAARGFEGLRTRDVAAGAGVNIATLHYYYPTKEALIRGVLGHVMRRFRSTLSGEGSPAAQLRGHLRGLLRLLREEPELFAVMGELALRAQRDPGIAELVGDTSEAWHLQLRNLVRQGVEEGDLDPGLRPDDVAAVVVAASKGVCMLPMAAANPERAQQTFGQLERWLGVAPGQAG